MDRIKSLRETLQDLCDEAQGILNRADVEDRDLTPAEQKRWDSIMDDQTGELTKVQAELEVLEKRAAEQKHLAATRRMSRISVFDRAEAAHSAASGHQFIDQNSGRAVRALRFGERMAAGPSGLEWEQPARVGAVLADLVAGGNRHCTPGQIQAAIGSSDSAGGYLLQPAFGAAVLDLARSASVALRSGAQTLPMDSAEMNLARVASDPTAQWRAEGVAVTASDVSFDRVILRPKTVAAIVPVSLELAEDSSNILDVIERCLSASIGLAIDQAVLSGSGAASEPLGILNHSSVAAITSVGTPADWTDISAAVGDILGANYDGELSSLAWILNPRDGETFDGLQDTTNQPLQPSPWAAAPRRFYTTSLAVSGGETSMIVGDMSQVVLGMRTSGVSIRIATDGTVSDGTNTLNATSELRRFIVAHARMDVAIMRPDWIVKLTGVTAS